MHLNIPSSSLPGISDILRMAESTPGINCFFRRKELEHVPMQTLFDRAVEVVTYKKIGYDIQAHSLYCLIISELLSIWYQKGFRIRRERSADSEQKALVSAAEYISCHYPEELRVEHIAARAGMSYSSFAAKFRRYYGMPCTTYIRKIRVSHAEDLLLQTDYDLSYISQETGFCDCSHLIRAFNRYTYRRRNSSGKDRNRVHKVRSASCTLFIDCYFSTSSAGSPKENTLPSPGRLSAFTHPLWTSAIHFTMESPRPEWLPPVLESSAR